MIIKIKIIIISVIIITIIIIVIGNNQLPRFYRSAHHLTVTLSPNLHNNNNIMIIIIIIMYCFKYHKIAIISSVEYGC